MEPACTVVAHDDKVDALLAELATFRMDLILSDVPIGAGRADFALQPSAGRSRRGVTGPQAAGGQVRAKDAAEPGSRPCSSPPAARPCAAHRPDSLTRADCPAPVARRSLWIPPCGRLSAHTGRAMCPVSALVEERIPAAQAQSPSSKACAMLLRHQPGTQTQ